MSGIEASSAEVASGVAESLWFVSCGFMIASDDLEGLIVLGCCDEELLDDETLVNLVAHSQSLLCKLLVPLFRLGVDGLSFNDGKVGRPGDRPGDN